MGSRVVFALGASLIALGAASAAQAAPKFSASDISYNVAPRIVTTGAPGFGPGDVLTPNNQFTGVGDLISGQQGGSFFRCTASRISNVHILTAAHCITDAAGNINADTGAITFSTPNGLETHDIASFAQANVHPNYNGNLLLGHDVAVLELATQPTSAVATYGLYQNSGELGGVHNKVGYGRSGTGDVGDVLASGDKRTGQNVYDATGDQYLAALGLLGPGLETILSYDFDNGDPLNDAFGFFFDVQGIGLLPGISDTGLGDAESNSAPGDSGGPTFIDGLIAGVTSFGLTLTFNDGTTSDLTQGVVDSTFGEFSGDARVSRLLPFINSFLTPEAVPTPGALSLIGFGGIAAWVMARRRRRTAK